LTILSRISSLDERDKPFITGERTAEGFYRVRAGIEQAIARAVSYAPFVDLLWCETSEPNLSEAKRFAEGIHQDHPQKRLRSTGKRNLMTPRSGGSKVSWARWDTSSSSSPWPAFIR
jgi:isocitrate lyase